MVMVLEQRMVSEIARIGQLRAPQEACGLMLPIEVNGVQIIELPNRSTSPNDSFEMLGKDMLLVLEQIFGDVTDEIISGLTAWHTHPGGNLGPSPTDLHNKPLYLHSLVVTLAEGEPPKATWY